PLREETLCLWAARRMKRPVRWTATRAESLLSDEHARDLGFSVELGVDAQGCFTALKVIYEVNAGAYVSGLSASAVSNFGGIAGVYRTPRIYGEARARFTTLQSLAPYRGAGRPEATYVIERVIDLAAEELGLDPVDIRRRNLIPPAAMPYQTPFVFLYD